MARSYVLDLIVNAKDNASGPLGGIGRSLTGLSSTAQRGFGGLQKAVGVGLLGAVGAATGGVIALGAAFSDATALARVQANAEKQLDAVLESTGHAAGLTADELKAMASGLQGVTNFGDEATIAGQSLLLTFTNIGKDTFPRATETMLDMSQALGQDMKSSAIQLGKALNDPITGVSALARVGVSFTEQQKDQIKAMAEAGDVAGAQAMILDELGRQFGGSARAMADPAIQLSNAWGDFKEVVGGAVLPIINGLAQRALPLVSQAISTAQTLIAEFNRGFERTGSVFMGVIEILDNFIVEDVLWEWVDWAESVWQKAVQLGQGVMSFIQPIADAIAGFVSWKDILIIVGGVVASIVIPALVGIVAAAAPVIAVAAALVGAVALVRTAWENDWGGIRTALTAWWTGTGQPIFNQLRMWLAENLPGALETLRSWWEDKLLPGIRAVWQFAQTSLIPLLAALANLWLSAVGVQIALLGAAWDNVLKPALTALWSFVQNRIIPALGGAKGGFEGIGGAIQGVIGFVNSLAERLGNLAASIRNLPRLSLPSIPGFASGTPFAPGGMALVGERGPELVSLPRGSQVFNANDTRSMMGQQKPSNQWHINITVPAGSTESTGQAVARGFLAEMRARGAA